RQPALQFTDGEARITGPHEHAVDLEPRRIAESFEARCCFIDLHAISLASRKTAVNGISSMIEVGYGLGQSAPGEVHHGHQLCHVCTIASPAGCRRLCRPGAGADWCFL